MFCALLYQKTQDYCIIPYWFQHHRLCVLIYIYIYSGRSTHQQQGSSSPAASSPRHTHLMVLKGQHPPRSRKTKPRFSTIDVLGGREAQEGGRQKLQSTSARNDYSSMMKRLTVMPHTHTHQFGFVPRFCSCIMAIEFLKIY